MPQSKRMEEQDKWYKTKSGWWDRKEESVSEDLQRLAIQAVKAGSEVRTTSETGGQKGVKPERWDLIPWRALAEVSRVYAFGATKYEDHNWRKGYEWSKAFAAEQRHVAEKFWGEAEDLDPESGLNHLAHGVFHLLSMLEWSLSRPEFDDRFKG